MAMALLNLNREPYEPQDTLVLIRDDGTADLAVVTEINDERLYAESPVSSFAVPVGEYTAYVGRKGRIFLAGATADLAAEYQRIADLERSTVLRQITHYAEDRPAAGGKLPMGKLLLIGGAVLLLIIMMIAR